MVRRVRVLSRKVVTEILVRAGPKLLEIIERAYLDHGDGKVVNPHSSFLRPPGSPSNRIIALPAGIFAAKTTIGIKWIASFPENRARGLERASAIIILNDPATGYPIAVLEGAVVSAWRTALSACLACTRLDPNKRASTASLIGCGVIATRTLEAVLDAGWTINVVNLFDIDGDQARKRSESLETRGLNVRIWDNAEAAVASGEIVIFATTAQSPWFQDAFALSHHPVVLHLSLRDLDPSLLRRGWNLVDDLEHATRAGTSLELARKQAGTSEIVVCDMHHLLTCSMDWRSDCPAVFSPFGLGMLDITLAQEVASTAMMENRGLVIDGFFDG